MQLPDGWTSRKLTHNGCDFIEIVAPSGQFSCSTTVDLERRAFRVGYSFTGPFVTKKIYGGRGWRERLVADAVAHLHGVAGKAG